MRHVRDIEWGLKTDLTIQNFVKKIIRATILRYTDMDSEPFLTDKPAINLIIE